VFDVGYANIPGGYDLSFNNAVGYGRSDVFVTKYNSTGNALLFSTYLGGAGTEVVTSMVVDGNNNLCLYGATSSTNFPVTAGVAYPSFSGGTTIGFTSNGAIFCGGSDIYISKFNTGGTTLLASTYYGGTGNDGINYLTNTFVDNVAAFLNPCATSFPSTAYDSLQTNYGDQFRGEIQVDALNNIYIVSSTRSSNIPIVGGFDNTLNGAQDAILAKFNSALTALVFSSYYGGSHNDCGNGIFISPAQDIYFTGGTCSFNLAGTQNGHHAVYQGGKSDGFLCMVNPAGNAIVNATYIGTNNYDNSFFVSGDNNGKVFVYGQSYGNMPVQAAPTTPTVYNVPGTHQFISAYTKTLNALYMSTVFGSKQVGVDISPSAFKVDTCNKIVLSGWGGGLITNTVAMNNMPILKPLPNHSTTTGYDFYLMALDTNATALLFGSYFGGFQSSEHVDGGTSRFDPAGNIYQSVCAGCGGADDFPLSPGAWPCPNNPNCINQNPSNNCNNGVFKVDFELERLSAIHSSTVSGCTPLTVSFSNEAIPFGSTATYTWNFGNGQTNSTNPNPSVTYTTPGTYTASLYVFNPTACITKDSSYITIQVLASPVIPFTTISTPCNNTVQTSNTSSTNPVINTFMWDFGDGSPAVNANAPAHTYTNSGIYTILLSATGANSCSSILSQTIGLLHFQPGIGPGGDICNGNTVLLNAFGGNSYTWSPANSLSAANSPSPLANPSVTTIYTVQILNSGFGQTCADTKTTQVLVRPSPTTSFNYTANPCGGGVNFFDQSQNNIVSWSWTLASNATSTLQNPYHFYVQGGTYTVSLVSTNSFSCQNKFDLLVQVSAPPPVSVMGGTQICIGNKAQLYAFGGESYTWSPASSLDFPNSSSPIASPSVSTNYSVVITTSGSVNGEACKFLLTQSVNVSVLSSIPTSAFANPTVIKKGDSSTLIYTGSPGAFVQWYPLNSTTPAYGYTVTANPNAPSTFTAVATSGACRKDHTVFVDVYNPECLDKDMFIPNTFTPNNDGNNDKLFVRGLKVEELYFAIYNRWGEKVFETKDRSTGWDGTYNGKPADVGVFGWYLEVKCKGGEEAFLKGNVTLIR
jgi:gliding motility-associated-like protein